MSDSNHQYGLKDRVVRAAETALSRQHYVSAIDVLCGMGLLQPKQVDYWRKGQLDFLEQVIQGSPTKISSSLALFRSWALEKGLNPSETAYTRATRTGAAPLQFTKSGDPAIETTYRTHYVSPVLSTRKQETLEQRLNKAPQPVVFQIVAASQCSECGTELAEGSFLFKEGDIPLCMACAGFADLEFLPAGDVALTRRATKYSARPAVVVRFNRARKRYERQGILAETAALEKAEQECLQDAGERAAKRARDAVRRHEDDRELKLRMAEKIGILFPKCPPQELTAIAEHTATRGSGRVGRSEAGRNLEESALTAAVIAAIRHRYTDYDELLARGVERTAARQRIASKIDEILAQWRAA